MFGHVQANFKDLTEKEKIRYRAFYCGLCRTLGERHGSISRLVLNYDLTFLAMFLSSLYEPEENAGENRCVIHPLKKHKYTQNTCVEYAADMTVVLMYFKCLDDWQDEHSHLKKWYLSLLSPEYEKVKTMWPRQCRAIEECLAELSEIERTKNPIPDAAANCCGRMMSAVFLYKSDHWKELLYRLGFSLGKYIYLADAMIDIDEDKKRGNYNSMLYLSQTQEEMRSTLMIVLGDAAKAFEMLPLVQDVSILRNILYSGLWMKFNSKMERRTGEK